MTYYAIRHKPSGKLLPTLRKRRGHTHTEPMSLTEAVPRLHMKIGAAKNALHCWLRGKWHNSYNFADGFEGAQESDGHDIVKQPYRIREDMEIVTVTLAIGEANVNKTGE